MTKEEWVALFQAMNGRDPLPQEFLAAKNAGEFTINSAPLPDKEVTIEEGASTKGEIPVTSVEETIVESEIVSEVVAEAPAQNEVLSQVETPHESLQEETAKRETIADFEPPLAGAAKFQSNNQQGNQHFYQQESSNSYSNMNYQFGYDQEAPASYFDGGVLEYWLYQIGGSFLMTITFLIATPWVLCMIERWRVRHIVIDGRRLRFDGTGGQLFGNWIKWLLLTIITIGIYGFWVAVKLEQWKTKHTHFE